MSEDETHVDIRSRLESDLLAVDLQWSLLTAAAYSYRHDSVLRPFPPMFVDRRGSDTGADMNADNANGLSENRNYAKLVRIMSQMPPLTMFLDELGRRKSSDNHISQLADLLQWTCSHKMFTLSSCDNSKYEEIIKLAGQSIPTTPPRHVFAVMYNESAEKRFTEKRGNRPLIYAFHGSRLENFHSILNYGLQGHMTKNAIFGEGTYLSSELSVCLHYSPNGLGWEHSVISPQLSCVAVCEIIDDPSVKCKTHDTADESRNHIRGSIGGEVPEKYYVVQNNEVVRLKYLFVYPTHSSTVSTQSSQRRIVAWLNRHRFVVVIGLYLLLLLVLGIKNSNIFANLKRRFSM